MMTDTPESEAPAYTGPETPAEERWHKSEVAYHTARFGFALAGDAIGNLLAALDATPRDFAAINATMDQAAALWNQAREDYRTFHEVRVCVGSA